MGSRWYPSLIGGLVFASIMSFKPPAAGAEETSPAARPAAMWIWARSEGPAPRNRFTYFRKLVDLKAVPEDARLRLAADSNARVWINGHIVRRKVARYHEPNITTEVIHAAPYLRPGPNVVVVLHHNWGDIITFQRSANRHAGLYVQGTWLNSDTSWRCRRAPEIVEHEKQIVGTIGDPRIRYPQIIDGRKTFAGDIHHPDFDDRDWQQVIAVTEGPWPVVPADVETPGQREHSVRPAGVVAAGLIERAGPLSAEPCADDPHSMAAAIRLGKYRPHDEATGRAAAFIAGNDLTIAGRAGETHYVTFDFHRPIHGYPFIELAQAPAGAWIDLGYGELAYAQHTGQWHVNADGWINPEGVVGAGYADRYVLRAGAQALEIPDERTARWLSVHVHFPADGRIVIRDLGIVSSQYPVRPAGSFECGHDRVAQIVRLCLIHAEVTMSDTYVDTPGREDGQWIEDARPRALLAERWFGDDRLRKLMIRTLAEGQGEDGQLHPFFPSSFPAYPAPHDWSVQWVAMLYDQYMWSGRADDVRPYWPKLRRYWAKVLSYVDEDGLWRAAQVLADIRVGVHPSKPTHSSGIVTPWMIERLRWSVELAQALGEREQAARWTETADRMTDAFRRYHVVPAGGGVPAHVADVFIPEDPNAPRGYSQAGQTIAVTCPGLLTDAEAVADLNHAFPAPDGSPPEGVTRWNNPTYGYRSLRALSHVGLHDRAVAHLLERYVPYLPGHPRNVVPPVLQGPFGGPLPEYWVSREDLGLKPGDRNPAQPADETGSHGWGAVPLLWLHDSLLGVQITEPGGGGIRIAPRTGGLPYVSGHTMTPKGPVWVWWDPQQWRLEVEIPRDVTATLVLPESCRGRRVAAVEAPAAVDHGTEGDPILHAAGRYVLQVN